MPLKLNVGISKKIGQPDFGSLGASCNVEVELESSLLHQDLDGFHRHVRNAFAACQKGVVDELTRAQQSNDGTVAKNGQSQANGHRNGHSRSNGRKATNSQVRAIFAIADRQGIELGDLLRSRYGVEQSEDLTITEASQLIDEMKGAANGAGGRQ